MYIKTVSSYAVLHHTCFTEEIGYLFHLLYIASVAVLRLLDFINYISNFSMNIRNDVYINILYDKLKLSSSFE